MERHRETPVENPVKPHDHAVKSIKENPYNDDTYVAPFEQKLYTGNINKNAPDQVLPTPERGLTTSNEQTKGGAEMIVSQIPEWIATKDIAINYLEFADHDYRNAKSMRIFYAQAARSLGVTLQQIADIYGMTTSGVHLMLKRAGGA